MKFGPVPLSGAEGAMLAHSIALPKGRLRKGKLLSRDDVAALRSLGLSEVIVARLEPGDLPEDEAAARIAAALVPDPEAAGLKLGEASTGRVNLHAAAPGVLEVDAARINALNAIHPMITVATLPEWQRVAPRTMAATVKIISYAVPQDAVEAACEAGRDALRLHLPVVSDAALIQTVVDQRSVEKGEKALRTRLARLGVALADSRACGHEIKALTAALRTVRAEVIFILTGSATSDSHDIAPEAVRQAGGEVTHFGMPVDPGNLLFYGTLGTRPVIGLPGCARSPALNGADWVMERILCGVDVSPADIAAMGVGGLLMEIPTRPSPRDG
ncbi:molybdenum cofactor cytidylyltransferase [Primorskyibacter sedentarius]|uniref:Molybdenum cofactor cytidylyltransferase n=1 Tax=Primorskyibacter sedentarius TaxID=745311 RepID=A0A4R3JP52_9RHOB|nr:molybdopterin-binding protein [Primorskyibacter sedentarius]TCS67372.1 molybdenum cofactor cytidylyltransferase [Primorskyibacter sedentarius]